MKIVSIGLLLGFILTGTPAFAIEEPKYALVLKEGDFEIRDYQPAVAAEVAVTGNQHEAANRGFRLLAGYIFGGNKRRQSIAMTAPVAQERAGQTIAMTAPVTQTLTGGAWVVRFTMPSTFTLDTLPQPNNPLVHLRALPSARFAVVRFSGLADGKSVEARTAELDSLVRTHKLRVLGPPSLAQYNPPWTLWFMRRNEVMVPVAR